MKTNEKVLKDVASKISELIISIDTDDRGFLLKAVAESLRMKAQGFTASCISAAAQIYNGVDT